MVYFKASIYDSVDQPWNFVGTDSIEFDLTL